MDFSSKMQTPLTCKRKRVDNSDIEEQRIANYAATWTELEGYMTELSTMLDFHVPALIFLQQSIDNLKKVFMIKAGMSLDVIKEKESERKSSDINMAGKGDQVELQRNDKYVHRQSVRSSYNVVTNYEALKKEIGDFLERVTTFIKEIINRMRSSFAREEKYQQELASIAEMFKKTHAKK